MDLSKQLKQKMDEAFKYAKFVHENISEDIDNAVTVLDLRYETVTTLFAFDLIKNMQIETVNNLFK